MIKKYPKTRNKIENKVWLFIRLAFWECSVAFIGLIIICGLTFSIFILSALFVGLITGLWFPSTGWVKVEKWILFTSSVVGLIFAFLLVYIDSKKLHLGRKLSDFRRIKRRQFLDGRNGQVK
jgi:hypothetical protein